MKTDSTENDLKKIREAIRELNITTFDRHGDDAKTNAQRNLNGRTHYVDNDTLKWHKSRVVSARAIHGGLLFLLVTSDALDMNNTRRGFRAVVFDVFGTIVSRPSLEEASSTKAGALKKCEAETVNLLAHYKEAINRQCNDKRNELSESLNALAKL
jgi:hypothetical protein